MITKIVAILADSIRKSLALIDLVRCYSINMSLNQTNSIQYVSRNKADRFKMFKYYRNFFFSTFSHSYTQSRNKVNVLIAQCKIAIYIKLLTYLLYFNCECMFFFNIIFKFALFLALLLCLLLVYHYFILVLCVFFCNGLGFFFILFPANILLQV